MKHFSKILLIALLGLFSSLCPLTAEENAAAETMEILPYLQNPTQDAMTICFLSQKAADVKAILSVKGSSKTKTVEAVGTPIPQTTWTVWKARVTGLKPAVTYNYLLDYKLGKEAKKSAAYSFTTFNPGASSVKAVAFNDIHDNIPVLEALLKNITPKDYEFTLLVGDMWNDPSSSDNAKKVFETMEAYVRLLDASNKPMLYQRGNHDTRGYFAETLSYLFDLPNNDPAAKLADQNAYYDFRYGPVWFISPDAGEDGDKRAEIFKPYRDRQIPWLKNLFAKSPNLKAPWRILVIHIPLYNPGGQWDQTDALERWAPVLDKERIDIMISGHDHTPRYAEKGKPFIRKGWGADDPWGNKEMTPPYHVFIGGGPNLKGGEVGTVMLIKADSRKLNIRVMTAEQKQLQNLELKK